MSYTLVKNENGEYDLVSTNSDLTQENTEQQNIKAIASGPIFYLEKRSNAQILSPKEIAEHGLYKDILMISFPPNSNGFAITRQATYEDQENYPLEYNSFVVSYQEAKTQQEALEKEMQLYRSFPKTQEQLEAIKAANKIPSINDMPDVDYQTIMINARAHNRRR